MKLPEFNLTPGTNEKLFRDPYTPPYISSSPQIISRDIVPEDSFVIVATDGLWDGVSNEEAVLVVADAQQRGVDPASALMHQALEMASLSAGCPRKLLDKLPEGTLRRRIHDDISIQVIML